MDGTSAVGRRVAVASPTARSLRPVAAGSEVGEQRREFAANRTGSNDGDTARHFLQFENVVRREDLGNKISGIDHRLCAGPFEPLQRFEDVGPILLVDAKVAIEIQPIGAFFD